MVSLSLKLPSCLDVNLLPQHVAVIMDGNGRWAKQRGLPRIAGHRQGVRVLKELLRTCKDWGVGALTAYAFSTENWKRPWEEVEFLMRLFEKSLNNELAQMDAEGVCINFIGDLSPLPASLRAAIDRAVTQTCNNTAIKFNVAINYGGRSEIIQACRQVAAEVANGNIAPVDIDENVLEKFLYTANCVEPDLLIRTSGEMRLSNFLLWQLAYAEMYFTDVLFPDFNQDELQRALIEYQKRDRRFGGIKTTISA